MTARNIVITGASPGIGQAIAQRFVNDGARVALLHIHGGQYLAG